MSNSAPWMKYGPTSEQEVVVLFALLLPHLPFRLELDEIRQRFPDCLALRVEEDGTRSPVRIEFELYASHFSNHGHDPDGCDLIVCWEDDVPGFPITRLALRPLAEAAVPPVIALPIRLKYEATSWTKPSFLFQCPPEQRTLHAELLAWATSQGEVVFGKGAKIPSWTLQIRLRDNRRCTLLGTYANGKIWAIWKKLPGELAEPFMEGLRLSPRFKAAIESGKAWCEVAMQDDSVLPALRAAVTGVTSRLVRTTPSPE